MPRSIRHLLAASLAVAAISVTVLPAFAADQPILSGTVLDAAGEPFPVENGTLTMTAPDGGGIYGAQVSVGGDGSFEVEVMPWGTDAIPAEVTISITGVVGDTQVTATGCTDQFAPVTHQQMGEVMEALGMSRVTARRYLEYLADAGTVSRAARYGAPGRPENEYRWTRTRP